MTNGAPWQFTSKGVRQRVRDGRRMSSGWLIPLVETNQGFSQIEMPMPPNLLCGVAHVADREHASELDP